MSDTENSESEDWTKGTWDLYCGDVLVTALPALLWALGVPYAPEAEQRKEVLAATKRVSWQAAPAELKAETEAWLARPS